MKTTRTFLFQTPALIIINPSSINTSCGQSNTKVKNNLSNNLKKENKSCAITTTTVRRLTSWSVSFKAYFSRESSFIFDWCSDLPFSVLQVIVKFKRKSVQIRGRGFWGAERYKVNLSLPLPWRLTLKLISAISVPITKKQRENIRKRNEKEQKILRIQPGIKIFTHSDTRKKRDSYKISTELCSYLDFFDSLAFPDFPFPSSSALS